MICRGRKYFCRSAIAGAALYLILSSCAEIRPPSGGQPDKTPPKMVASIPASGETGVSGDAKIKIKFSESVQGGTGTQVFISPKPAKKPKVKWHGRELSVGLPEPLAPNQTYVIQVSATTADLRGNKLDSAVIIAFSTGTIIDSGVISGTITQNGSPAANVSVALYELSRDTATILYDSVNADYMTAANQKGSFEFRFLPSRSFQLVAFSDKNRNEMFNPKAEPFGIPDRPINLGDSLDLTHLSMELVSVDTTTPQILSALYTQNRVVRARLTKDIPLAYLKTHLDAVLLIDSAAGDTRYHALDFAENLDSVAANLTLLFGDVAEGFYQLKLSYDSLKPALVSPKIAAKIGTDKEAPTVLSWRPGEKALFVPAIKIGFGFSEPIDSIGPVAGTTRLIENDKDTIAHTTTWADPFHLSILPEKLIPGAKYRLDLFGAGIRDRAGNMLADSLTSYRFSTLSEDSLGSVSGSIVVDIPGRGNDPVVLLMQDIKRKSKYRWSVASRQFQFDLPAGKYLLSGFVDSDRDGLRSTGSLSPFRTSETFSTYPDTISVRARFETAAIEFQLK